MVEDQVDPATPASEHVQGDTTSYPDPSTVAPRVFLEATDDLRCVVQDRGG